MKRITFDELERLMYEHGATHENNENPRDSIHGVIVYKASNWEEPYTERERSYRVSSCNRCFQAGKISSSLYGDCLDGSDKGVRLDWYKWKIEYCYME